MSRPLPILSNMPWNVKQSIINEVDYMTRFSLRKCSKELRGIIDNSVVEYPTLFIAVFETNLAYGFTPRVCERVHSMHHSFMYSQVSEDSCMVGRVREQNRKTVNGQNYIERAVSDMATFLKNPRSSFYYVYIDHPEDILDQLPLILFLTCLKNTLETLPHQLNIQKLTFRFSATQEQVLHVLPYLKPGVLKLIQINNKREVDELVNTEQWRMAVNVILINESNVRIQDLLHLRHFSIESYQLAREEMPLIIQAFLTQAKKPLYSIGLPQNYNLTPIRTWLNGNETLDAGRHRNTWHTKIQGTRFHLEIVLSMTRNRLRVHRFSSAKLENV